MAKRKNIAQEIKKLSQIGFCARGLRNILYFYAIISFIFWVLNCFEVDWLYLFNPLFKIPFMFVRKVLKYSPQGVSVDFSLTIIGGISLILGFAVNWLIERLQQKIYDLEEEEEKLIYQRRTQNRKSSFQGSSEGMKTVDISMGHSNQQYSGSISIQMEDPKLLFLIAPQIKKIKRREDDIELTLKEVQDWKLKINKKLLEQFIYSKPTQKGYYRKNLFLLYNDFNYVEDFVYNLKPTLTTIITEFKKAGILVSFCSVLSSISDTSVSLEKELDLMDIVLSLKFYNEIMLTQRFKINYDNQNIQQYEMKFKGEYNLSKNLTVTNRQPLFMLQEKTEKEETK